MQAVQTYVANQQVLAAELNDIQTRAAGLVTGNANNAHDTLGDGLVGIEWMYGSADLAAGTLVKIDGTADFRDAETARAASPLAGRLFDVPGVTGAIAPWTRRTDVPVRSIAGCGERCGIFPWVADPARSRSSTRRSSCRRRACALKPCRLWRPAPGRRGALPAWCPGCADTCRLTPWRGTRGCPGTR